jgi:hypothetical protein
LNTRSKLGTAWLLCMLLVACAGTRTAYQTAATPLETATVVGEHYYALVKEAADLKNAGALTSTALAKVQAADRAAKPVVVELTRTVEAYQLVKSAQNEAAMQIALNKAVLAVNSFINALRSVRGTS